MASDGLGANASIHTTQLSYLISYYALLLPLYTER